MKGTEMKNIYISKNNSLVHGTLNTIFDTEH